MDQHRGREHELFKSVCDKCGVDARQVPEPEEAAGEPGPGERARQSRGRSERRSASRARGGPGGARSRS
eukprot:13592974-Alexandrium_andersonii.AAC.1